MDGCLVMASLWRVKWEGGKHVCVLKSPEFIHPVNASVFGHFVQISFLGHLPCIRWGKDSPKEKVIKQLGNGSNRGRSSRYFGSIKDRRLTPPRVGRGRLPEGKAT